MQVKGLAVLVMCLILSSAARADDTKSGTLALKPETAAADVVAVLTDGADTYTLSASGDVATKLGELAKKGAKVQLSGTVKEKTMQVTAVTETTDTPKAADDKADKKKNKGDKKKKKADKNAN